MERTFTIRHEIEVGTLLNQVRKEINALGCKPIREGEFEMLGDNTGGKRIRCDDPFVVAQYTVSEIDVLKGKIPNIMKIPGIKKTIIFGEGLTLFTFTSVAKIVLPTVGVGMATVLGVYLSDPKIWEFLEYSKSIVQASISITGFVIPGIVLILAEWSKRKKIKEAYENKNGKYKKINYGDYEDLMHR